MCHSQADSRFSALGTPKTIWAVSAIHGDLERLVAIHDTIFQKFSAGDRLLYMGNYTGYGDYSCETIDELLTFRRLILAQPSVTPDDIVYLRGAQEEMWNKLTQIQFDPDPINTLIEMMGNGLSKSLQSYGICAHEGIVAAREGMMSLTKWAQNIQHVLRINAGHGQFLRHNRRAAYTQNQDRFPMLFVNAGVDPSAPLNEQNDKFWRADNGFEAMTAQYDPFEKVVRGYDPRHGGVMLNCITATLDGGCGFGGSLVCAGIGPNGEFQELLEA